MLSYFMPTISISVPEIDLEFLENYATERGTTIESFMVDQVRTLREQLQKPLHPDVEAATAAIRDEDANREYLEHLASKYE